MKRKIQTVLSFLILLVFLAGTTGITLFIHTCSSSQKTEISAYPEVFSHSATCCCDDENTAPNTPSSTNAEINSPACCRNQHLFLKASIIGLSVTHQQFDKIIFFPIHPVNILMLPPAHLKQILFTEYLPWLDHSPPISGKTLVYFIHQIRIPFPVC